MTALEKAMLVFCIASLHFGNIALAGVFAGLFVVCGNVKEK